MATHNDFGNIGEALAAKHLEQKGFQIIEKNWRFKKAEIDIIGLKNDLLIIVEVKSRSYNYYGAPQHFISPKKIRLLVEAANEYINQKEINVDVRFDVIGVLKENGGFKIEHLENAFLHF